MCLERGGKFKKNKNKYIYVCAHAVVQYFTMTVLEKSSIVC